MLGTPARFVSSDRHTFLVAITSYENKNPVGTIFSPSLEKTFVFCSLGELLLQINDLLDTLDQSGALALLRHPPAAKAARPRETKPDVLATFRLKVLFRQNLSWQGTLTWMEAEDEAAFRSELELISLINSALSEESRGASSAGSSATR